jgi:hypothetical protein
MLQLKCLTALKFKNKLESERRISLRRNEFQDFCAVANKSFLYFHYVF